MSVLKNLNFAAELAPKVLVDSSQLIALIEVASAVKVIAEGDRNDWEDERLQDLVIEALDKLEKL